MRFKNEGLNLTNQEITRACQGSTPGGDIPLVLSVDQAAALLQVPKATIYAWNSRGLLKGCGRKIGKHLRFFRDRLLQLVFNHGLYPHDNKSGKEPL